MRTLTTVLSLNIGYPLSEIFEFFAEDLKAEYGHYGNDPHQAISADRQVWLGRWVSPNQAISAEIEAIIIDRNEAFDWEQWKADENKFDRKRDERLLHQEAVNELKQLGADPATLWPLLCFGYQQRGEKGYFANLKHNPTWLIAPGTLNKKSEPVYRCGPIELERNVNAKYALRKLIEYYGPSRVFSLVLFLEGGEEIDLPADLTLADVDKFTEMHTILCKKEIYEVKLGDPPAICTARRPAFIGYFGEPGYPRVMGIRIKNKSPQASLSLSK